MNRLMTAIYQHTNWTLFTALSGTQTRKQTSIYRQLHYDWYIYKSNMT